MLVGCWPTPPPPQSELGSASPIPTPTPTIAPDDAPQSRLPVSCDRLLTASTRSRLLGPDAEQKVWIAVAGWRVGGMSECRWVGLEGVEIKVWILPEAEAAYEAAMVASYGSRPSVDRAGQCGEGGDVPGDSCFLVGLSGDYWYEIESTTIVGAGGALGELAAALHDEVGGALAAAGPPLPGWAPPPSAATFGPSCDMFDTAEFRASAGAVGPAEAFAGGFVGSMIFEASRRAGELACSWSQPTPTPKGEFSLVTLQGLTGSGWVWAELLQEAEERGASLEPLTVTSAESAVIDFRSTSCTVIVLVDGTVFSAAFQRYDETPLDRERVRAVIRDCGMTPPLRIPDDAGPARWKCPECGTVRLA